MKYIRTKDGKILENKWLSVYDAPSSLYNNILKQADTIEELCDEIVIVENGSHSIPAYIEEAINRFMEDCEFGNNNIQIFDAIWTDKGLIYVAKMNDKGELELL